MKISTLTTTDPIADMLTRIRNAIAVNAGVIILPHSKIKETIAQILADNGFIERVEAEGQGINKTLVVTINSQDRPARVTAISRLSRPGRRVYVKSGAVPTVRRGLVIVSTSAGIMTGTEAKANNLGGELICEVY